MRKIVLSLAAMAALSFVLPYAATAKADQTVIIHRHHHNTWDYAPRSRDKTVIIKRDHDHDRY